MPDADKLDKQDHLQHPSLSQLLSAWLGYLSI